MRAYFVPSVPTFIPEAWYSDGTYSKENWPLDAVLVSEKETAEYWMTMPPKGKKLGAVDGKPAWIEIPPLPHEQHVALAESEKKRRIATANNFMNNKQWPGKAAMGRLNDIEKMQYNVWLDYLDAVDAIDVSLAPEIIWPSITE